MSKREIEIADSLRSSVHPLRGSDSDFDPLLKVVGDARFVLLGEASHGTHEFYRVRAQITKRLIAEKGFHAIAVEADWPDAFRVNQYVRLEGGDEDSVDALSGFRRFPAWMWRNADVLDFVGWLRNFNEHRQLSRVGFYGLDLYSMHASMRAVLDFLDKVDPEAARRARHRYSCFDHVGEGNDYGYLVEHGLSEGCENEAISQWMEMRERAEDLGRRDGHVSRDAFFFALQNARLVKNAEQYYRTMFHERVSSWNLRDRHMAETLDALIQHLGGEQSKIVVWAHNSHLGDARATEMGHRGEWNLGQIVRERYGEQSRLIGFTTHSGTVTAASGWDGQAERKFVRPALPGSYEKLFHQTGIGNFFLPLVENDSAVRLLREPRLERAIGVIYLPQSERASHYFHAVLPDQFDGVIHYDETRAVEPVERTAIWEAGEIPETYPSAL